MFQKLVSHNDDLRQLVEKGHAVGFDGKGYLIVRDVPYLDEKLDLRWGAIVSELELVNDTSAKQRDHQIHFAGSPPYGLNGSPIPGLAGGAVNTPLSEGNEDVVVQRSFSSKPPSGAYDNFFHKVDTYLTIISGPAMAKFGKAADPYTSRVAKDVAPDPVFKFCDTMTTLAGVGDLAAKFNDDVIAIVGLGGTGSYILDFLAKTRVREIRLFDLDNFRVHNAYRSPGRLQAADELGSNKAEMYAKRYDNFRHGLSGKPKFIDASSLGELDGVTFAFVSVDKGSSRAGVFDALIPMKIPFIDVGMGLNRKHGPLGGMLRVTYFSPEDAEKLRAKDLAELADSPNDEYRRNVQTSELNALNACLAVIKFKQLRGYYRQDGSPFHLLFGIDDFHIAGETEIKSH